MKKLFPLLLAFILLLCGCTDSILSPKPTLPDFSGGYTFTAKISGDADCTILMTRIGVNNWTAEFTEPYALTGTKLTCNGGRLEASYGEFVCGGYSEGWDKTDLYRIISALECAANDSGSITVTETADGLKCAGVCSAGGFTLTVTDGMLSEIAMDSTGTKALITDWVFNSL